MTMLISQNQQHDWHSIHLNFILYNTRIMLRMYCCICIEWPLQWHHDDHDIVSNHQPHDCLLNRLFRRRSKKTAKLRVTGLCVGKSPGPVNSPHKGPVTRKMLPFDGVIMRCNAHDSLIKRPYLSQMGMKNTCNTIYTAIKVYMCHFKSLT